MVSVREQVSGLVDNQVSEIEGGFLCLICGRKIARLNDMKRHMKDQHLPRNERYQCPICSKIFELKNNLIGHVHAKHKDIRGLNYSKCKMAK